jgi:hypothetical protein
MRSWLACLLAAGGCLALAGAAAEPKVLEAEDAVLSGGCAVMADHGGFSGKGFVARFYNNAQATAIFRIQAEKAGPQEITLRYSAGFGDARIKLTLNGTSQVVEFPSTDGSWETWSHQLVTLNLKAGENTLAVSQAQASADCINLDYVALGKVLLQPKLVEVEPGRVELLKKAGIEELVVVVRNFIGSSHNYTYFNEGFRAGGGLYVFNQDGFRQLISASRGEILDAELSYDGQQVLFSWKKDGRTNYDIFLVNRDGTGLRQLTRHLGNDFNASWLPDGGIAFLSDRDNNYAYCMHSSSAVLYRMELNGTGLKRLSANYLSDIAPHVLSNGKIVYCRWEYVDRFQIPCQGLWAQNPDGTNLMRIYGGRFTGIGSDPVTISEAKSVPGTNKIIATLTGHNGAICGGIGIIDPSKGSDNPAGITTILGEMVTMARQADRNPRQKYEFAYPVSDRHFLVSNDGSIQLSDYTGKEVATILKRGEGPAIGSLGFYAALPVQSRPREFLVTGALPAHPESQTAKVVMQDVYIGLEEFIAKGLLKRGDIKQIRVVQGLGKYNKGSQSQRAFCWQFPVVSAGATMEPKKTVSVVTVEADGSAMFEVPAMQPVFFQALDSEGRVIQRMRTFAQFMPGEAQSCTGCHLDRNTSVPVNRGERIIALQKPIQKINGAPWKEHPTAFSYPGQIQPILDRHCLRCHNATSQAGGIDLSGDRTDLFNVSYDNLVRDGANRNPAATNASPNEFPHKYVSYIPSYNGSEHRYMAVEYFHPKAWGAFKSQLATLVHDGHPDAKGAKRIELDDMEKRLIYAWIDYNIPYYPTSHTNHPELPHGMRELVPNNFHAILADVAARRCVACHAKPEPTPGGWFSWHPAGKERNLPLKFYLRWEKPELNNFMLAPLAKAAGGTGKCGPVFQDTNDPDYQKLLHAFDAIHATVKAVPRMDMPDAQEVRGNNHSALYGNQETP